MIQGSTSGYSLHDLGADVYVLTLPRAFECRPATAALATRPPPGPSRSSRSSTVLPGPPRSPPSHWRCRAAGSSCRLCSVLIGLFFVYYPTFALLASWLLGSRGRGHVCRRPQALAARRARDRPLPPARALDGWDGVPDPGRRPSRTGAVADLAVKLHRRPGTRIPHPAGTWGR